MRKRRELRKSNGKLPLAIFFRHCQPGSSRKLWRFCMTTFLETAVFKLLKPMRYTTSSPRRHMYPGQGKIIGPVKATVSCFPSIRSGLTHYTETLGYEVNRTTLSSLNSLTDLFTGFLWYISVVFFQSTCNARVSNYFDSLACFIIIIILLSKQRSRTSI